MKKALFILLLIIPAAAFAQLDNSAFEQRMIVEPADSNKLFLGINMLGFERQRVFRYHD
jgi:hypothetical protein